MKRCLLDSSFLIDLLNEMAGASRGPALAWLGRNPRTRLWISPVSLAEVLEGADDPLAVKSYLARFQWQGIGHVHAEKVAHRQRNAPHRLGENDAWQVAVAEAMDAVIVGHDPKAFQRGGMVYEDHRAGI